MRSTSFPIRRVNRLRRAAERARTLPRRDPDLRLDERRSGGWSVSACDPSDLIRVFNTLRLTEGFALRAYEYRSGGNGNGIIWAVPADAPLLAPEHCPRLEDTFLDSPRPPGAVPLMQAIQGDGSPWSYLSASILSREAAEFGAIWHGCVWSDQTILSKPPWQAGDPGLPDNGWKLTGDAPVGAWTWHRAAPSTWEPIYVERGNVRKVVLHLRNPVGADTIYRAIDTYPADSYDAKTRMTVLCTGEGGIVY